MQQKFDKKNIFIEMKGKKINMYDMIQAGREDTELYATLEKYGCIKQEVLDAKKADAVYGDLTEITNLRSHEHQLKKAENLWKGLPLETRREFDHDIHKFMDNGMEWTINKIKKMTEPKIETIENTQGVKVNGENA